MGKLFPALVAACCIALQFAICGPVLADDSWDIESLFADEEEKVADDAGQRSAGLDGGPKGASADPATTDSANGSEEALLPVGRHGDKEDLPQPRQSRRILEEIIVTAQKREEDIQSVPVSVTAISGDQIVEDNLNDMTEVADRVPNLDVLASPTFPSIYMRGLGSSFNRGFEQSVAILVDEVYYGRASYINLGLLDLDAIEVLRGPQGTLFGKNASAGVVHFRTALPERSFEGSADFTMGRRNHRRARIRATGPLTDTLSWRVAYKDDLRDGSVFNTNTGVDEENLDTSTGRVRLLWEPSSDFSALFTVNANVIDQDGPGTQLLEARGRHLAAMEVFDSKVSDDPYDGLTSQDNRGFVSRDAYDGSIKADWDLVTGSTLTSITNYSMLKERTNFDADASPIPFLVVDNNEDLDQFSQELRLTSEAGTLEYVVGAFYMRSDIAADFNITNQLGLVELLLLTGEAERAVCTLLGAFADQCQASFLDSRAIGRLAGEIISARQGLGGGGPVEQSLTRFEQLTQSGALFGQLTWNFAERWSTALGGRFNYERKSLDVRRKLVNNRTGQDGNFIGTGDGFLGGSIGGSIIFPIIMSGSEQFETERNREEITFIPRISVRYEPGESTMLYGTAARGFKSGGFNAQPTNADQLEFDEEDALSFELGVKSELLGGAARLNAAAFYTSFDGLQVSTFDGASFVVGNAASADIYGLEYDAMLIAPYGFLLSLNGAYTRARYDNFDTAPCSALDTSDPPCDLSGDRLRLAPEFKTSVTVGWQGRLHHLPLIAQAGITGTYNTDVPLATDLNDVAVREPGTTLGIRAGVETLDGDWFITVFGENITDREYLAAAQDVPGLRGTFFGGVMPDRRYSLVLGTRF